MITSALIDQCRREANDVPKSTRMVRAGNGSINLFNLARFPVIEGSYSIYKGTSAQTETTNYTLDKDNGDLQFVTAPTNGLEAKAEYKYANWNNKMWNEAINDGVSELNARGFFRQTVRSALYFSANVRSFSGPTNAIDVYEALYAPVSGSISPLPFNWSYQQDDNKLVFGAYPTTKLSGKVSYLRNMQTYSATSATLDVKDDWIPLIKQYAVSKFMSYMASKIATQGHATIEEGHFSFTNARTQANSLMRDFQESALRKKPTRPAKDIQYVIPGGGVA